MKRMRVAIAGLRRGETFLRVLRTMPDVEVIGLADPDQERRVHARSLLPAGSNADEADSLAALLGTDPPPDLVVLATPPIGRVADAVAALERGIHVLSEIPAAWTVEECDELLAAVEASTGTYMLAENALYWGFVDAARRMRHAGEFGRIFYAEAEMMQDMRSILRDSSGAPTWRLQRTDPITYCTHSLGPLLSITGQYPTEVTCMGTGGSFDEPEIHDVQTALLRLTDGALVRLTVSLANAHWHGHRFALFGTEASLDTGWVWLDRPRLWSERIPHLAAPVEVPLGTDMPDAPAAAAASGVATMNWMMMRDLLDALREGRPPRVDIYDALMFSLPGLLAAQSARAGGARIAIPQYQLRRAE
ncbi:MAG: Gfo/Idh/MocA family oxidoreductase [Chloroflexi bacterium]|nr:Gfo/Idh/MocA family oxidoreductase [Chloroflexota bacterium]